MKTYEVRYTVRGSGSFPEDMLRYDSSEPAEPEDRIWIENRDERELMLKATVQGPLYNVKRCIREGRIPCKARWESFSWAVTEVYEPKEKP